MGMDVYGQNPVNETGEYFRRNVWGWHPLWTYCEHMHSELAALVEHGHYNDGDGLDAVNSMDLGLAIANDVYTGVAQKYIDDRNAYLATLAREECKWCDSTGIRTDKVGEDMGMPTMPLPEEDQIVLGRTHGTCNACRGYGNSPALETNYYLSVDDILEFSDFLQSCGGFAIC